MPSAIASAGCVSPRGGRARDVARGQRIEPEDRARDFRTAGADEPGAARPPRPSHRANDTSVKLPGLDRCSTRSSSSPASAPDVRRKVFLEPPADHHLDEGGAIDFGDGLRGHVPAVAQHGDVIAQQEDLFEPMADVDARDAALAQPADQLVEPIGFVLRQAARRLVEDDDPRAVCDRRRDLQHLLLADRSASPTARSTSIDGRDRGQHLRRAAPHLAQRDETGARSGAIRGRGFRRRSGSRRTRAPDAPCRRRPRARRSG